MYPILLGVSILAKRFMETYALERWVSGLHSGLSKRENGIFCIRDWRKPRDLSCQMGKRKQGVGAAAIMPGVHRGSDLRQLFTRLLLGRSEMRKITTQCA